MERHWNSPRQSVRFIGKAFVSIVPSWNHSFDFISLAHSKEWLEVDPFPVHTKAFVWNYVIQYSAAFKCIHTICSLQVLISCCRMDSNLELSYPLRFRIEELRKRMFCMRMFRSFSCPGESVLFTVIRTRIESIFRRTILIFDCKRDNDCWNTFLFFFLKNLVFASALFYMYVFT